MTRGHDRTLGFPACSIWVWKKISHNANILAHMITIEENTSSQSAAGIEDNEMKASAV
jgi:hypothetical protein